MWSPYPSHVGARCGPPGSALLTFWIGLVPLRSMRIWRAVSLFSVHSLSISRWESFLASNTGCTRNTRGGLSLTGAAHDTEESLPLTGAAHDTGESLKLEPQLNLSQPAPCLCQLSTASCQGPEAPHALSRHPLSVNNERRACATFKEHASSSCSSQWSSGSGPCARQRRTEPSAGPPSAWGRGAPGAPAPAGEARTGPRKNRTEQSKPRGSSGTPGVGTWHTRTCRGSQDRSEEARTGQGGTQ